MGTSRLKSSITSCRDGLKRRFGHRWKAESLSFPTVFESSRETSSTSSSDPILIRKWRVTTQMDCILVEMMSFSTIKKAKRSRRTRRIQRRHSRLKICPPERATKGSCRRSFRTSDLMLIRTWKAEDEILSGDIIHWGHPNLEWGHPQISGDPHH